MPRNARALIVLWISVAIILAVSATLAVTDVKINPTTPAGRTGALLPPEVRQLHSVTFDPSSQAGVRLFRAEGRHQCQSRTDLGHKCSVFGTGYTDCTQARAKLQMEDCCAATRKCKKDPKSGKEDCRLGGSSIGFEILKCTTY